MSDRDDRAFDAARDERDEAEVEFTPIRLKRGRLVHAFTFADPTHTACGKPTTGGEVSPVRLSCRECRRAVFYAVE